MARVESDPKPSLRGAGFGDPGQNRRVEKAAVKAVTGDYEAAEWAVENVSKLNLGYDLLCRRKGLEHHVEVKGIRGSQVGFLITANEKQAAKHDEAFRLCAVTDALYFKRRKVRVFTGPQVLRDFDLQPLTFVAKPRA